MIPRDGRIDLSNTSLTTIEGLAEHSAVQYLYLRDNLISSVAGSSLGRGWANLKILDLGGNRLTSFDLGGGGSISSSRGHGSSSAPTLPHLRQLFLNRNQLVALETLPVFPELEVLSISNNPVRTLEGLAVQPKLTMLCATDTAIATTRGMKGQVRLEDLLLRGSPLTEVRGYRQCVAACCDNLIRLDDIDIQDADREATRTLSPKVHFFTF